MSIAKRVSKEEKKLQKKAFKADKLEAKEKLAALKIPDQARHGAHNCPHKDGGTTHAFRARCLKQQHSGYCPACGEICGFLHGCHVHGIKGKQLLDKSPCGEGKAAYRVEHGFEEAKQDIEADEKSVSGISNKKKRKGQKQSSVGR